MMDLLNNPLYLEELERMNSVPFLPWTGLEHTSILISGATGLLGSFLVDLLMERNLRLGASCNVYAAGRSAQKAKLRFERWWNHPAFHFLQWDVNEPLRENLHLDYVLHLASNTHPIAYATDPIGTILTNIAGTHNTLEAACRCRAKRFLFASSNEIYGENRGDTELFDESYSGYLDCNTLRAGYPEGKRCGEALCQAYRQQKNMDVIIARLTRSFGPTLLSSDSKALSQFIWNGIRKEDIVLKSEGNQYYSYTYMADAVTGLLTVLLLGEEGQAYNVADASCDIRLKDLAAMVATIANTNVIFDLPSQTEQLGFSRATKARLDGHKLAALGWHVTTSLEEGLKKTLQILSLQ